MVLWRFWLFFFWLDTPPKTHINPQNDGFQFRNLLFHGSSIFRCYVSFGGVQIHREKLSDAWKMATCSWRLDKGTDQLDSKFRVSVTHGLPYQLPTTTMEPIHPQVFHSQPWSVTPRVLTSSKLRISILKENSPKFWRLIQQNSKPKYPQKFYLTYSPFISEIDQIPKKDPVVSFPKYHFSGSLRPKPIRAPPTTGKPTRWAQAAPGPAGIGCTLPVTNSKSTWKWWFPIGISWLPGGPYFQGLWLLVSGCVSQNFLW